MSDKKSPLAFISMKDQDPSLETLLKGYTKPQILEIGTNLNATIRKSWNKDKMIKTATQAIIQQAESFYQPMLSDILNHFPDTESQLFRLNDLNEIEAFIPLIQKGFFFVSKTEDDIIFIIPNEIRELVDSAQASESDKDANELSKRDQQLIEWKDRLLKIYGSYSLDHIQNVWNNYYTEHITIEELETILSK